MALIQPPDDVQIKALQAKKKLTFVDLMAPGPGTPWENRGSEGMMRSLARTCIKGMFSPARLVDNMRRPDTGGDVTQFTIACGIFWSFSILLHAALIYIYFSNYTAHWDIVNPNTYWTFALIQVVAMPFVMVGILKFASAIYFKLIAYDMKSKAPPVLLYNVLGYGLAPSILSIIPGGALFLPWIRPQTFWDIITIVPLGGPLLALLWIFINWNIFGVKRLYVRPSSSIIAAVITFLCILLISLAVYFSGWWLWNNFMDNSVNIVIHRSKWQ